MRTALSLLYVYVWVHLISSDQFTLLAGEYKPCRDFYPRRGLMQGTMQERPRNKCEPFGPSFPAELFLTDKRGRFLTVKSFERIYFPP